jgi:hypothetical protein
VAPPTSRYEPRQTGRTTLHRVVLEHFETFRLRAASMRDGEGLPRFVEREFRDFLKCGCLAGGFARLRCENCGRDRLVPFSCKGRGFCPSCGGRRMAERAAHLVDEVFPDVPVRQWVLSLPYRLRYLLAWDHELCRAVVAVYVRAVLGWLRQRARRDGVADGRSGAVAVIQRFGGALNLNVHVHALILDGVFAGEGGHVWFHAVRPATGQQIDDLVVTIARRIEQLLERRGLGDTAEEAGVSDAWAEQAPVLAGLASAAVAGRVAFGPQAGARPARYGDTTEPLAPPSPESGHARLRGFDLHAAVVTRAGQRGRLERLCRYALRPPIAQDRLRLDGDGQVWLQLRHRWSDGTTHLRFDPLDLLGRLAALTPRPRINLILYYGVLAPRARGRAGVVAWAPSDEPRRVRAAEARAPELGERPGRGRPGAYQWADLMRRTFGFDVLVCGWCGGRMRLLALIEHAAIVERILRHLGLPTEAPQPRPARAPPGPPEPADETADVSSDDECPA